MTASVSLTSLSGTRSTLVDPGVSLSAGAERSVAIDGSTSDHRAGWRAAGLRGLAAVPPVSTSCWELEVTSAEADPAAASLRGASPRQASSCCLRRQRSMRWSGTTEGRAVSALGRTQSRSSVGRSPPTAIPTPCGICASRTWTRLDRQGPVARGSRTPTNARHIRCSFGTLTRGLRRVAGHIASSLSAVHRVPARSGCEEQRQSGRQ